MISNSFEKYRDKTNKKSDNLFMYGKIFESNFTESLNFEITFGRPWLESGLKSRCFVRGCPIKRQNITQERHPEPKAATLLAKTQDSELWHGSSGSSGFVETVAVTVAPTLPNTRWGPGSQ